MSDRAIPVFFNIDNDYTVPTYITLFSMLCNHREPSEIHAHILVGKDFSDSSALLLNSLSEKFQQIKVSILKMDECFDSVSINQEHITHASLYRLMIPRIMESLSDGEADKCIYLDGDLAVEGDISELFNLDIKGYYIGGVGDWLQLFEDRELPDFPSMDKYINSGVLLFNLKEINRTDGLKEKLEKEGCRNDFLYNDQDAINSVLYDGIKLLPLKYNAMSPDIYQDNQNFFNQYGKESIIEARKNPVIVHYITDKKPWLFKTTIMAGKWWKYIKMQDDETMQKYIIPFLKTHKAPFHKRVKETVKTIMKRIGIYYMFKHIR